jgi:tRNA(fMet)-specific endonuclease VapC
MFCLDTNIIVFFLKNQYSNLTTKILQEIELQNVATNSVVCCELLFYSYKNKATKSLELRQEFLKLLPIFDLNYQAANHFAEQKAVLEKTGQKIDDIDLQIASICLANDLTLVTNNTKHFERIEDLKLEDWTK